MKYAAETTENLEAIVARIAQLVSSKRFPNGIQPTRLFEDRKLGLKEMSRKTFFANLDRAFDMGRLSAIDDRGRSCVRRRGQRYFIILPGQSRIITDELERKRAYCEIVRIERLQSRARAYKRQPSKCLDLRLSIHMVNVAVEQVVLGILRKCLLMDSEPARRWVVRDALGILAEHYREAARIIEAEGVGADYRRLLREDNQNDALINKIMKSSPELKIPANLTKKERDRLASLWAVVRKPDPKSNGPGVNCFSGSSRTSIGKPIHIPPWDEDYKRGFTHGLV